MGARVAQSGSLANRGGFWGAPGVRMELIVNFNRLKSYVHQPFRWRQQLQVGAAECQRAYGNLLLWA